MKTVFLFVFITIYSCVLASKTLSIIEDEKGHNVIDSLGKKILKESFSHVYFYDEVFLKIQKKNKYGISNFKGDILLEPIYESISTLYKGYATINFEGKIGLIDSSMKIVLPPRYKSILIEEEYFIVNKDNQYTCMNKNFETVSNSYDYIYYFIEGFAKVETKEKFGFIDEECKEVVEVKYDYVSDFNNGFAKIKENKKFSFLNKDLEVITQEQFKSVYNFEGK